MEQKSFLFINSGGESLALAIQVEKEGHKAYLVKGESEKDCPNDSGIGLLPEECLISDPWEIINTISKEDLYIIFDDNGKSIMADHLKEDGYKVIGGGAYAAKIEHERSIGTELMKTIGLNTPTTVTFDDLQTAMEYVRKQPEDKKMVFKPEGEEFAGSSYTYTSKNGSDLLLYMQWIDEEMHSHKLSMSKFELQDFVEGLEADFEATFNGYEFMPGSVAIDIEKKKSGDGEKGEATGCMGQIEFYVKESRFFDQYMKKLEPVLRENKYVGAISINCIFDKEGEPYGLEFTSRYGWDATISEMGILLDSGLKVSDWLMAVADKKPFEFPHNKVACAIRMYVGSVGNDRKAVKERYFTFKPSVKDNLFFYEVSHQREAYIIEGNPPLVVNFVDKSIQKAIEGAYKVVEKVYIPDRYYRMEVGDNAKEVINHLRKYQWI